MTTSAANKSITSFDDHQTLLANQDREHFDGKLLSTGISFVTAESRFDDTTGSVIAQAFNDQGLRFEIVFPGLRAMVFLRGLGATLTLMQADNHLADDFRANIDVRHKATITGTFKHRQTVDAEGKTGLIWQLTAAEWTYEVMERGAKRSLTEGFMPSKDVASYEMHAVS